VSFSVLVLTLNEEVNLTDCLKSVEWSDDVVVFDSYSADRTVEISRSFGATVVQRRFNGYASQRNAALNQVIYKHPWVLMLDADERVTRELRNDIEACIAKAPGDVVMFRIRRKDYFMGRWLRRSSGYPTWFGRLVRPGRVRVEREVNEEYHADGKVGAITEHLIHFHFNKGIANWFERHNTYSTMEAETLLKEMGSGVSWRKIFSRDPVIRRKGLKRLAHRLPATPLVSFVYLYLFRLGFLDGIPGLAFCVLRGIYECMVALKVAESRRRQKCLPL
jgi:glycosyltransferase involved in cell wall biosynthesis